MDLEEVVTRAIEILFKYLSFFELSLGRLFALGETQTSSGVLLAISFDLMGSILHISHEWTYLLIRSPGLQIVIPIDSWGNE